MNPRDGALIHIPLPAPLPRISQEMGVLLHSQNKYRVL